MDIGQVSVLSEVVNETGNSDVHIGQVNESSYMDIGQASALTEVVNETGNSEVTHPTLSHSIDSILVTSNANSENPDITDQSSQGATGPRSDGVPLHPGIFLGHEVFELLTKHAEENNAKKHAEIPHGIKENIMFAVDNTANAERKQKRQNGIFRDDCGVYDTKKNHSNMLHLMWEGDNIKMIRKKGGLYGTGTGKE
jgi:hypothetical protein